MTTPHRRSRRLAAQPPAPGRALYVLAGLLLAVFLMGGGSRGDISSLIILRPVAAAFAAYAVWNLTPGQLREIRVPLTLLVALAAWIALQLVPLPPAIWTGLPARGVYAEAYRAAGLAIPWQPLALSPARALNALMSLLVPLAVLLCYARLAPPQRERVWLILWLLAVVSAGWGVLQLTGSSSGPLYLYRVSNFGTPVGLFANRNHQALLLAIGIVTAAGLLVRNIGDGNRSPALATAAAGTILVFAPLLLLVGSRAGLALGLGMLIVAGILVVARLREGKRRAARVGRLPMWLVAVLAAILLAAVLAGMLYFSRTLALDRLLGKSIELDVRFQAMPTVLKLASEQFLAGSGFGSFDLLYRQAEPFELLMPAYLNHAHNDWLQIVIEGGVPAIVLLVTLLAWLAHTAFILLVTTKRRRAPEDVVAISILVAIALASVVDYPLRTPAMMAVAALCCAHLSVRRVQSAVADDGSNGMGSQRTKGL